MKIQFLDASLIRRFGKQICNVDFSFGNILIRKRLAVRLEEENQEKIFEKLQKLNDLVENKQASKVFEEITERITIFPEHLFV